MSSVCGVGLHGGQDACVSILTPVLDLEEGLGSGLAVLECQPLGYGSISSTDELRTWEQGCQGRWDRVKYKGPTPGRSCRAQSAGTTE